MTRSEAPAGPGWPVVAALVACTGVSILSTDLYVPSLPDLPRLLATDASTVQLTMSLNLGAYAVAILLHGLIVDRVGYKRMLVAGMVGLGVASAGCALASSIGALIGGRVVQGVFGSVPGFVVLLLIRGLFHEERAARVLAWYGMVLGAAPALGPLIGGYIHVYSGWRTIFWVLTGLALATSWIVVRKVPDVRPDPDMSGGSLFTVYARLLARCAYLRLLLPQAAVFGALFAFVTNGPFLLIDRLAVRTEDYGLYYFLVVLAFSGGAFVAGRLVDRVLPTGVFVGGILATLAGVAVFGVPVLAGFEWLALMMAGMGVFAAGLGLMYATGPLLQLRAAGTLPKGPASALLNFGQLVACSLGALAVGELHDGSAWPVALTMMAFVGVGSVAYFVLSPRG